MTTEREKIENKIKAAGMREEAARLRVRAATQMNSVKAYLRTATNPKYEGQEIVCADKAQQYSAHADLNRATADKMEAEADLLDLE